MGGLQYTPPAQFTWLPNPIGVRDSQCCFRSAYGLTPAALRIPHPYFLTQSFITPGTEKWGRPVRIGDVIDGAELPLKADWFTGKLQFLLGDIDDDSQTYPLIVELDIHLGRVIKTSSENDATPVYTWNGLP